MGNKSSQAKTISETDVQTLLEIYSPICELLDEQLGRMRIYRKKQFNFDYIALMEKVMSKQLIEDCKKLLKLRNLQNYKEKKGGNFSRRQCRIIKQAELWLRIFSFQIFHSQSNNENLDHLKICIEYLNFSLKQYVCQYGSNLQGTDINLSINNPLQDKIPKQIGYILGCVLDAYIQLRTLHQSQPCINILSMLSAITNPSFIYVNLDGCLKFLPIPLFIFIDYFTKMDKCMIHCCKFPNEDTDTNGRNIVVPKYGNTNSNLNASFDKLDKIFMTRFKKLMKYIRNEMALALINKRNNDSSEEVTHVESLQARGHLRIQSNRSNISARLKSQLSFWDSVECLGTVEQLINKIKNIDRLPQNLQFGQGVEGGHEKKQEKQKIRLQKYNKNRSALNISYNTSGSISKYINFQNKDDPTNITKFQNKSEYNYLNLHGLGNHYENAQNTNSNINKNVSTVVGDKTNINSYGAYNYHGNYGKYEIGGKLHTTAGMTSKQTSSQNSNIRSHRIGAPLL